MLLTWGNAAAGGPAANFTQIPFISPACHSEISWETTLPHAPPPADRVSVGDFAAHLETFTERRMYPVRLAGWLWAGIAILAVVAAGPLAQAEPIVPAPGGRPPTLAEAAGEGQGIAASPLQALCAAVPPGCREHIHVFFINGCDPFGYGDLSGLCDCVKGLGFKQAKYGQMYNSSAFGQDIRQIKMTDPNAYVAVVGYSLGARCAWNLTQGLQKEGLTIDLLVYIAPAAMGSGPSTRPDNALRIVNITGWSASWSTDRMDDRAENHHLGTGHFSVPTHSETVQAVVNALVELAGGPAKQPTAAAPPPPTSVRAVHESAPVEINHVEHVGPMRLQIP
jgi:hypothetical protein